MQQVLCTTGGVDIDQLIVPVGTQESVRCNQSAGADARNHGELRTQRGLREADQCTGAKGAVGAAPGESQDVDGLSCALCSNVSSETLRGYGGETLIGPKRADEVGCISSGCGRFADGGVRASLQQR